MLILNVNEHLNFEQNSTLNKFTDYINPLITSRLVNRILTIATRNVCPQGLGGMNNYGKYYAYNEMLINVAFVDMINLSLIGKSLNQNLLVIYGGESIVRLVDVGDLGLLYCRNNCNRVSSNQPSSD